MKKDEIIVLVSAMIYLTFLLMKISIGWTVFGLLLLVIGLLNCVVKHKKTAYLLAIPLTYTMGLFFAYVLYNPDTFTMGITLTILIIICLVTLNLQRKKIKVD